MVMLRLPPLTPSWDSHQYVPLSDGTLSFTMQEEESEEMEPQPEQDLTPSASVCLLTVQPEEPRGASQLRVKVSYLEN